MLVFAAHVPHTPLVLPSVGREHLEETKKTREALKIVAEELYASRPEVIIILAGHGNPAPDAFAANFNDSYKTNLAEFGDIVTKLVYPAEIKCADKLQRLARHESLQFTMFSDPSIGHAVAVPLITLTEKLKKFTILPLFTAPDLSAKEHFDFGKILLEVVASSDKRVAIISSGDLSHALTKKSPAGFKTEGQKFDNILRESVNNINAAGLVQLDPKFVKKASQCTYRSVLILLGVLESNNAKAEELCYEAPFGVGYLTVMFRI
jgi:AmmeMemoRadiSam system protein B